MLGPEASAGALKLTASERSTVVVAPGTVARRWTLNHAAE